MNQTLDANLLPGQCNVFSFRMAFIAYCLNCAVLFYATSAQADPIPSIPRKLPPVGFSLPDDVRQGLQQKLAHAEKQFASQANHEQATDIAVLIDAVLIALRHNEFYNEKDADRASELLDIAQRRLKALAAGNPQWLDEHGLIVRGYQSSVDGSAQPYGLVIPAKLDLSQQLPLYVWLHGRGDKTTNLTFIHQRLTNPGNVAPPDAITLHPFGRHCVGYKSAGEVDVLEAVEHVCSQYNIDRRRIVLMGFSMGGAGVWHLGAHYPDRWVAMSPGAGFAETAQYQKLDPAKVTWYERQLWGVYDVPGYVGNLFNLPVIAYSGEIDKQKQAADVMASAFAAEGQTLDHRIGPGMAHKYHPHTLKTLLEDIQIFRDRGLDLSPRHVTLQTETLRYHKVHWVDVQRLDEHWRDTRVEATVVNKNTVQLSTRNVAALQLTPTDIANQGKTDQVNVVIDGQTLHVTPWSDSDSDHIVISLTKTNGQWTNGRPETSVLAKQPGLQGPIDDAFLEPFLVVLPTGQSQHPAVQRWVDFEQNHFLDRWLSLFRGAARVKQDVDVTPDDLKRYHLILWGDPASNAVLARIVGQLPVQWSKESIHVGTQQMSAAGHVLTMIYPNPESPGRYVVLNSGPTFREGHDRTNSLQNPKLPDWAVIDLSQLPDSLAPGRIAAADFFDEQWQLRPRRTNSAP